MLTDAVLLVGLGAFSVVAIACPLAVPTWPRVMAGNTGVAVLFVAATALARRKQAGVGRFLLRTGAVCGVLAYLFGAVAPLQLVLRGRFLDAELMAFEKRVLALEPVSWLERFHTPGLTEWLMFCYLGYLALYPLVCGRLWVKHGELALEECLLPLAVVNVACDVGFVLFPVAGPTFFAPERFPEPLVGGPFTVLAEFVRSDLHFPGGSLPSPHCAAATVLWLMAWRYERTLARWLAPVVLSLYVATVYGRFHYLSDSLAGIVLAVLVVIALRRRHEVSAPGGERVARDHLTLGS